MPLSNPLKMINPSWIRIDSYVQRPSLADKDTSPRLIPFDMEISGDKRFFQVSAALTLGISPPPLSPSTQASLFSSGGPCIQISESDTHPRLAAPYCPPLCPTRIDFPLARLRSCESALVLKLTYLQHQSLGNGTHLIMRFFCQSLEFPPRGIVSPARPGTNLGVL